MVDEALRCEPILRSGTLQTLGGSLSEGLASGPPEDVSRPLELPPFGVRVLERSSAPRI